MRIPDWLPVYGDPDYRGPCPHEEAEQRELFRVLRMLPIGALAVHPPNEGKRSRAAGGRAKSAGLTPGAPDLIIPGTPCIVIELKRRDRTKSRWQPGQLEYLRNAMDAGCVVGVALGARAAIDAVQEVTR